MSSNEAAGGLHASNVDEVSAHNGQDQFVWTQDEATLFYLWSQEKQALDNHDGSIKRPACSALRILELKELLGKVTE